MALGFVRTLCRKLISGYNKPGDMGYDDMIFRGYDIFQLQHPWGPTGSKAAFVALILRQASRDPPFAAGAEVLSALDEDGDGKVDLQAGG